MFFAPDRVSLGPTGCRISSLGTNSGLKRIPHSVPVMPTLVQVCVCRNVIEARCCNMSAPSCEVSPTYSFARVHGQSRYAPLFAGLGVFALTVAVVAVSHRYGARASSIRNVHTER